MRCPVHTRHDQAIAPYAWMLDPDHMGPIGLLNWHEIALSADLQYRVGQRLTACGVPPYYRTWNEQRDIRCALCRCELFVADCRWLVDRYPGHEPSAAGCAGLFASETFFDVARDIFRCAADNPRQIVRWLDLAESQQEECWWLTKAWRPGTWPRRLSLILAQEV